MCCTLRGLMAPIATQFKKTGSFCKKITLLLTEERKTPNIFKTNIILSPKYTTSSNKHLPKKFLRGDRR